MKPRTIICAGVAAMLFAVPPLLNWVLRSPTPFDAPVVGQSTDWLTFWGAYLGGILAAVISFIVLYYTHKQNYDTQIIQMQENAIRELENKIISRIEQIDFPQLYQISLKSLSHITEQESKPSIKDDLTY